MSMVRHHNGDGFTLVEVVVSLGVLSLIMLATVTGLRTLGNTQGAIDRLTLRTDEIRTVSGFLRDTLESSVVGSSSSGGLSLGGGGGAGKPYFDVSSEALEWKATVLFGEGYGGSHFLRVAREKGDLVLRWQESGGRSEPEEWKGTPSRALIRGIEDLDIAYQREHRGDWLSEWDRRGLPVMVRLQLKVAGRYWPDLILPVPG